MQKFLNIDRFKKGKKHGVITKIKMLWLLIQIVYQITFSLQNTRYFKISFVVFSVISFVDILSFIWHLFFSHLNYPNNFIINRT